MRPGEIASKGMDAKNQASQFAKKAAIAGDLKQEEQKDCQETAKIISLTGKVFGGPDNNQVQQAARSPFWTLN